MPHRVAFSLETYADLKDTGQQANVFLTTQATVSWNELLMRMKYVIPSDIFSPASGGSVNVSIVIEEIRAQGRMRLNP